MHSLFFVDLAGEIIDLNAPDRTNVGFRRKIERFVSDAGNINRTAVIRGVYTRFIVYRLGIQRGRPIP